MATTKKTEGEKAKVAAKTNTKKSEVKEKVVNTAKAGKRSAKSLAEGEAKQAKEERKLATKEEAKAEAPKKAKAQPKTRTRLERRAKAYREKYSLIDINKRYNAEEATKLIGSTNPVKFDATVELHIRLNVDPKQADQNIRDNVMLPAGSGKKLRVAVFVDGEEAKAADKAGADLVGEANVVKELEAGSFSFDVLIATPTQMPKLGKYARVLGPRGLMPNPKSGTVTTNIAQAVTEAKSGKVEYRVDNGGNLHIPIGKSSFKPEQLLENLNAVMTSVNGNKPASIKGTYILSSHLTTSMGPALKLAF